MKVTSHVKFFLIEECATDNNKPGLGLMEITSDDFWTEVRIECDKGIFHLEFNQTAFPVIEDIDTKQHIFVIQDLFEQARTEYEKVLNEAPDADPDFELLEYESRINLLVLHSVPSLRDRLDSFANTIANNFVASINTATQKQLN